MRKIVTLILFLMSFSFALGQNRIPQNGENIIFYPFNEVNSINKGYDCFYSLEQVISKGKYNFKPKYRFKRNEFDMTSAHEIEGYTFHVKNQEIISEEKNDYLLLYLRRNEDNENIVLRIPQFYDDSSNEITQSFIRLKLDYDLNYREKYYCNVILPYVNVDTLNSLRNNYVGKDLYYGYKKSDIVTQQESVDRNSGFDYLSKAVNGDYIFYKKDISYNCVELDFYNISNSLIYKQLCALMKVSDGNVIKVPVVYLVGNTDLYDKTHNGIYNILDNFFRNRDEYVQKILEKSGSKDIIKKFTNRKVYYGLNKKYNYNKVLNTNKFNALENRVIGTDELYTITEGAYDCVRFDVYERFDKDYTGTIVPFAVLKDSLNVEFRVPLEKISFNGRSYPNIFCENFDEYFVLTEQVDSIIQYKTNLRLQKEAEDKERMRLLINKYGKTYADFLFMKSDKTIERFNLLAQKYGKVNAKLMIEGEVRLGWSKDMCRESWGEPHDINTTTASWGVHEQWVYELSYNNSFKMCFLYFKNGVLTTIQN